MPTMTQLVNHRKRKQSNHANDSVNKRTKRRRLDSDHDENKAMLKCEDNSHESHRMSRPRLLPKRGITSMKSSFDNPDGHRNDGLELGRELEVNSVYGYSQSFTKDKFPRSLLKKKYVDESHADKKLSTLTCAVTSHNDFEPEDSCVIEGKDVGMKQPVKSEPVSPDSSPSSSSYPVSSQVSNVVLEGYVHRLANLNARACVAAYLQPDKKVPSKRRRRTRWCKRKAKSKYTSKCDNDESAVLNTSPKQVVLNIEESTSNPVILNVSGVENVIPVITFSGMKMPPCAVVVEGLDDQPDDDQAAYNTMGLLHNGDTLHPHTQVFLEGSHELHLPSRIVPTLVPLRQSTVRRAVKKAISVGIARRHRKPAKV